jgi:hypothetical protein
MLYVNCHYGKTDHNWAGAGIASWPWLIRISFGIAAV